MRTSALAGLLFIFAGLAACAPASSGPDKVVLALYGPYLSHEAEQGGSHWEKARVYSKSLKAVIDRGVEYGVLLNEPVIDYDPIANGQEYSVSKLKVVSHVEGEKAHVTAHFDNLGTAAQVEYELIEEDGRWRIDQIGAGEESLRNIVEQNTKPVGDPELMKAPVQQIYEMYAPPHSGASEPLYKWAYLSKDFQPLMRQAAIAKTITPDKGKDGIGFDPVTDGQAFDPDASINLEAAGSAVIARIGEGDAQRVVVYDVAEEDGDWKITDIRGPKAKEPWDVRVVLSDAGIN